MTRNRNGVIALNASEVNNIIDMRQLTIGDALLLKHIFNLSDAEATVIFLGGLKHENV